MQQIEKFEKNYIGEKDWSIGPSIKKMVKLKIINFDFIVLVCLSKYLIKIRSSSQKNVFKSTAKESKNITVGIWIANIQIGN